MKKYTTWFCTCLELCWRCSQYNTFLVKTIFENFCLPLPFIYVPYQLTKNLCDTSLNLCDLQDFLCIGQNIDTCVEKCLEAPTLFMVQVSHLIVPHMRFNFGVAVQLLCVLESLYNKYFRKIRQGHTVVSWRSQSCGRPSRRWERRKTGRSYLTDWRKDYCYLLAQQGEN